MARNHHYVMVNEFITTKDQSWESINQALHSTLDKIVNTADTELSSINYEIISHSVVRMNRGIMLSVMLRKPIEP